MLDNLSTTWSWSPGVIIFLLVLTLLYLWGLRQAYVHNSGESAVSTYRVASFFVAIVLIGAVLLTPINTIARTQLFSMHMLQVVVLTTICAPLVLAACSAALLRPLTELPVVKDIVRALTRPLVASLIFNILFLLWHTPRLYDLAMGNGAIYSVMMLSIFCTSLLNWWPLIGSVPELRNMSYPIQMLYAFFDGQPVDIFAFVLVFSGVPIYTHYATPSWWLHVSSFADQAAGGALLLIPGLVDLGVMSPLFFRWLGQIEEKTRIADQKRMEELEVEEDEDDEDEDIPVKEPHTVEHHLEA
jgi:cytochrome c oxidase assembly factor CtaG